MRQSTTLTFPKQDLFYINSDLALAQCQEALNLLSLQKINWEQFLERVGDPLRASRLSAVKEGRSLLHLAVIDDQREMVQLLASDSFLQLRTDSFGLCPLDLAQFLGRRECEHLLQPKPVKNFSLFSENAEFSSLEYLEQPIFESTEAFASILTKTAKGKHSGKIPSEKVWMGIYYNQEIQRGIHPAVSIRLIDREVGYGVFAEEKISPCTIVGEYTGIIQERNQKELKEKRYCLRYTVWEMGKRNFTIDAERKGNFTRFINHSTDPNLGVQSVYWKGLPRMIFIALREIPKGTQLTFDYGPVFWKEFRQIPKLF